MRAAVLGQRRGTLTAESVQKAVGGALFVSVAPPHSVRILRQLTTSGSVQTEPSLWMAQAFSGAFLRPDLRPVILAGNSFFFVVYCCLLSRCYAASHPAGCVRPSGGGRYGVVFAVAGS